MALRAVRAEDLDHWVSEGWLTRTSADAILEDLREPRAAGALAEGVAGFNLLTLVSYLGALLILSALGWFLVDQWDDLGAPGILLVSAAYAALFLYAGHYLRFRSSYPMAGGLLFTCSVWMVPLMVFAIEKWAGYWPVRDPGGYHDYYVWINGSWIVMEWATILAGLLVLKWVRFPFLTFPIAFALWFFSMDLTGIVTRSGDLDWQTRAWCSVWVGAFMLIMAFALDRRFEVDLSFWIYLFGLAAFWGGLTSMESHDEWRRVIYLAINLALGFLGLYLRRPVFVVFATAGVILYLGHLAREVFRHSPLFPFVVAFIGLAAILAAVGLQRRVAGIDALLDRFRPLRLRET